MRDVSALRWSISAGALAAACLLLAACGDTVIDKAKLDDATQASLERSLREKIRAVDCPSDLPVDAGTTFTCDVTFPNGERAVATLENRNKDADVRIVGLKTNK